VPFDELGIPVPSKLSIVSVIMTPRMMTTIKSEMREKPSSPCGGDAIPRLTCTLPLDDSHATERPRQFLSVRS
jgi:hypothetical protein